MLTLATVFACRTSPRTAAAAPRSSTEVPGSSGISEVDGQVVAWIEPSCHHDQVSSVAKGRNGAKSRNWTESATSSARRADAAPSPVPYGAALHELEVVVAKRPEERLDPVERAGVLVVVEGLRRDLDHVGEAGEHRGVEWSERDGAVALVAAVTDA